MSVGAGSNRPEACAGTTGAASPLGKSSNEKEDERG